MSSWPGSFPSKRAFTFSPGSDFPSGSIQLWNNTSPLSPDGGVTIILQIAGNANNPSAIPIREVYFPVILSPIAFYLGYQGVPVGVEPDYVTEGSGCECVDFDAFSFITLHYPSGTYPGAIYVFLRSLPTGAFRVGPLGAQVTAVTATLPIISSGGSTPNISLDAPLPILFGGTGTPTPQLIAGTGINITGTPFDWTISLAGSGFISEIEGIAPITVTGGMGPTTQIGLNTPLALNFGGTGYANPLLTAGTGISITGNIFQPSGPNAWTIVNDGVTSAVPGTSGPTQTGAVLFESKDGSLAITGDNPNNALNFEVANGTLPVAVFAKLDPAMINGAGETVALPTLPGSGNWYVEVIIHGFGLGPPAADSGCTGNTITLTGAGWGFTVADDIVQCQGTRTLYVCGVVSAGNAPSVTITGSGVTLNSGTTYISLGFKAIPIS